MNTAKNLAVNGKNAYFFYIPFRQKMKNQIKKGKKTTPQRKYADFQKST